MQSAEDIVAIQQLLAAYVYAIDAKDYDALDAVFLPGATVDYRAAGGAASPGGGYGQNAPFIGFCKVTRKRPRFF